MPKHYSGTNRLKKFCREQTKTSTKNTQSDSLLGEIFRSLTSEEIQQAIDLVRGAIAAGGEGLPKVGEYKIGNITLVEPVKKRVLKIWLAHEELDVDRLALAEVYDHVNNLLYEFLISLTDSTLLATRPVPGAQPAVIFADEYLQGPVFTQAAAAHYVTETTLGPDDGSNAYRLARALRRRGLTRTQVLTNVIFDPWSAGYYGTKLDKTGRRMGRWPAYFSTGPDDNYYSRPIENLYIITDRNTLEILKVVDGKVVPIPDINGNFATEEDIGVPYRENRVLEYNRPQGVNVTVGPDGHVTWEHWSFYVRFDPMRGIILNAVDYNDPYTGTRRPIIYQANLSDMVVPYGSPDLIMFWRNAFDIGEYGIGMLANTLVEGEDVPLGSQPQYLDGVFNILFQGENSPSTIPRAIAIYEEDGGILWKHTIFGTAFKQARRATNLVVLMVSTVGNYEYVIRYVFHQDGCIKFHVQATGIAQTQAAGNGYQPSNAGTLQGPLKGTYHQHFFCFRIDPCVDGPKNTVIEVDAVPCPPGKENPFNNAFEMKETVLTREKEARRLADPNKGRAWKISNSCSPHRDHHDPSYMLMNIGPQTQTILADEESWINRRALFANYNLWVTRYHRNQEYAAGRYINQNPGPDGLPKYIKDDESLVNKDVVLWALLTQNHFPTPEDFPVVNTTMTDRALLLCPMNFFKKNPALDLPPPPTAEE